MRRAWILIVASACSGSGEPSVAPAPVARAPSPDAAVEHVVSGLPVLGMHLDDDAPRTAPRVVPAHAAHPIDITLRSTPSGALAMVDGIRVGTTPTFWTGDANGLDHQFAFTLAGFTTKVYKFVPVTSGVVHARLDPLVEEPPGRDAVEHAAPIDAGVAPVAPPDAAVAADAAPIVSPGPQP